MREKMGSLISSNMFSYDKTTKTFAVEESTLRGNKLNAFGDSGLFQMKSEKTGNVETFYLSSVDSRGGEILAWRFNPVNEGLRSQGVSVVVFND